MYFPKSQIKSNLYTNGDEYINSSTKETHKGYYYEVSNGNKYTGKTPEDGPNILLIPPNSITNPVNETLNTPIGKITLLEDPEYKPQNHTQQRSLPSISITTPTTQDQQLGIFNRYFCKKNNELMYMEISKETYTQLKLNDPKIAWDLYSGQLLLWQITGTKEQVYKANKSNVSIIETQEKWHGFSQYFKDKYLKYYQSQDINDLYTSGGEFTTKNRQNYIGFYHIHNGITPMVGKTHINTPHDVLLPTKKSQLTSQTTSSMMLPTPPTITGGGGNYSGGGSSMGGGGSY